MAACSRAPIPKKARGSNCAVPIQNRDGTAIMACVVRFVRDCTGSTAIEYALIAGGIAIVIVLGVQSIATTLNGIFTTVSVGVKPS